MPLIDLPLTELERYTGRNPRPADHDTFWDRALAELADTPLGVELIPAKFQAPFAECFHLYFTGVRGARIHAKYLRPRRDPAGGKEVRHPALLQFHGYTGSSGDWTDKLPWVARGFSIASLDCRGQAGASEDSGGTKGTTQHGHIIRGLEDSPDNLMYRQIFLDTAALARIVGSFDEVDPSRMASCGASQGGALALACAALVPSIRRVSSVYPFLCDYQRVWEMDLAKNAYAELRTFFRNHDPTHARESEWFTRLGYIDVQYLAPRIRGEVLMAVALMDEVCPPST
ncbi:MAG TPA: acetylxylan esterase, partial [Polyangiaceae bacterium]